MTRFSSGFLAARPDDGQVGADGFGDAVDPPVWRPLTTWVSTSNPAFSMTLAYRSRARSRRPSRSIPGILTCTFDGTTVTRWIVLTPMRWRHSRQVSFSMAASARRREVGRVDRLMVDQSRPPYNIVLFLQYNRPPWPRANGCHAGHSSRLTAIGTPLGRRSARVSNDCLCGARDEYSVLSASYGEAVDATIFR